MFFERLASPELERMSEDVRNILIENAITMGMKVMVEGFSKASRCCADDGEPFME